MTMDGSRYSFFFLSVVLVLTNTHCQASWQLMSGASEKAVMFGLCAACVLVDNV